MPPTPKRPIVKIEPGAAATTTTTAGPATKKAKTTPAAAAAAGPDATTTTDDIQERFLALFAQDKYQDGISNTDIETIFGSDKEKVVPVINALLQESRLIPLEGGGAAAAGGGGTKELFYKLVSEEDAKQFYGLDPNARLVYQSIQRAGQNGAWTKDIRRETNIQPATLNKIFKSLENRRLIKQVKSVNAKAKKLYMLYDLQPSTELTGGVWYSDLEFDHEFISELRGFFLRCLRGLHNGTGCTIAQVQAALERSKVSRDPLTQENVQQLMGTLLYDHLVEVSSVRDADDGSVVTTYTASRKVNTACEFQWWNDALSPDFHFRTIRFEDGVVLDAHEPHYHTA